MEILSSLEQSGLATWIREGGTIWSYPLMLFLHTFGLATLAGISASIDLRVLGVASQIPLAPLRRYYPLRWGAFAIAALSGTALLIADLTARLSSPIFWVKMLLVGLAVANMQLIKQQLLDAPRADEVPVPSKAKTLAVTSLLLWIGATTAGRLMAYLGPVGG
jgi:hypothetical protein